MISKLKHNRKQPFQIMPCTSYLRLCCLPPPVHLLLIYRFLYTVLHVDIVKYMLWSHEVIAFPRNEWWTITFKRFRLMSFLEREQSNAHRPNQKINGLSARQYWWLSMCVCALWKRFVEIYAIFLYEYVASEISSFIGWVRDINPIVAVGTSTALSVNTNATLILLHSPFPSLR